MSSRARRLIEASTTCELNVGEASLVLAVNFRRCDVCLSELSFVLAVDFRRFELPSRILPLLS
jgi:hypothetical protein